MLNFIKNKHYFLGSIMHKLRIGVLMGGKSIEREVSFNSGRTVCDHLDTYRYTVIPIFQRHDGALFLLPWHFLHRGKISDFEHRLENEATRLAWDAIKQHVDFMYLAVHGHYAEDGSLQGMLEILNIPYLGSKVFASALGMDKGVQKHILQAHNIAVPAYLMLSAQEVVHYANDIHALVDRLHEHNIHGTYVVKPRFEGSSLGISIVKDTSALAQAMMHASTIAPGKPQSIVIEEQIIGMEFSCIAIMHAQTHEWIALPPTEIVPEDSASLYDYEQKYMPGKAFKCTPARCSQEALSKIQDTCIQASKVLDFSTLSRIDGFFTQDQRVVIIDPNTLSGMAPSSYLFNQAAEVGMSHADIINHFIATELHAYGMLDTMNTITSSQNSTTHDTPKLRVAVLLGGDNSEREISLESGRNIIYKLSPHKYQAIPIFVDEHMHLYHLTHAQLVRGSTKEIASIIPETARIAWNDLPSIADFVFIALHGSKGENGSVQGTLEMLGLPYNGSGILASALCMDKYKANHYLATCGFDAPRSILIDDATWQNNQDALIGYITQEFELPCIIKPHDDGCSFMVNKITSADMLSTSIATFFQSGKKQVLIEEFITGMELTVGVIGNANPQALPPSQAVATRGILSIEEKFLPGQGENITPAPLCPEDLAHVQRTIEQVYQALDCKGYARIDCFFQPASASPTGKKRVVILEINTLPGMTPATCIFHQAAEAGMRPMEFIDRIITLGLEEHQSSKVTLNDVISCKPEQETISP